MKQEDDLFIKLKYGYPNWDIPTEKVRWEIFKEYAHAPRNPDWNTEELNAYWHQICLRHIRKYELKQ